MSREKELVKKTGIYAVGNLGAKVLSYVMVLVYSYFILPDEMGYYDLIITTVAMIQPLVIFQMNDGIYRFLAERKDKNSLATVGTGVKFLVLTTLFTEFVFFIISFFYHFEYAEWIALYICSVIFYAFFQDAIRGFGSSKLYAFTGVLNSAVMLVYEIIGLMFLKQGVKALLISKVVANYICIILLFIVQKELRESIKEKFDKKIFKELLRYSAPLVPNTICWWIVNASDRYIILYFLGTSYNGIYSMATKFPTVLTTLTSIFYLAWQEAAIKEYDTHDRDSFFSNIFKKYYVLLFTLGICAIPATKLVIELLVSSDYKSAWMYTGFLYLGAIFSALCSFLGLGYQISKQTERSLFTTVFAAILNVVINIVLIRVIGLQAASFSTFAAYLFLFIIRLKHTERYYKLSVDWKEFITLFAISLALILFVWSVNDIAIIIVATLACIVLLIYKNKYLVSPVIRKVLHKY